MNRWSYYTINPDSYLFRNATKSTEQRLQPEESVRQWCAFELIRAYGICINQLEFERKVRVGSKIYRIDILVLQNGIPWAVIECKEPGHTKHGDAMEQAVSYANAEEIRAVLVVYTNGREWHVRQRMADRWVSIPDLPRPSPLGTRLPLVHLLQAHTAVAPMLHKLGEPLDRDDARKHLSAMQNFFNSMSLLTVGTNRDLLAATDNLLRVLSAVDDHSNYRLGKVAVVAAHYEAYRIQAGYSSVILPPTGTADVSEELQHLHVMLQLLIEGPEVAAVPDAILLRLNTALLQYGSSQGGPRPRYPLIANNIHDALRDYLAFCLTMNLNASLPDPLDHIAWQHLKDFCALTCSSALP